MSAPRSLRRQLITSSAVFAVVVSVGMLTIAVLFASLRRSFERDIRTAIDEHRAADEVVTVVYAQLVDAYQQLQSPARANVARFDSLGQAAHMKLRDYLFRPMSLDARLQVERIKELHEALEVEAHRAFDLVGRGDAVAAQARMTELNDGTRQLRVEMERLVALLGRERAARHAGRDRMLKRSMMGFALGVLLLVVAAAALLQVLRRRVVVPLEQLTAGAVRLGTGDLTARMPPQRHAEFANVARSFNEMASSVEQSRAEIVQRNAELTEALSRLKEAQQELVQQERLGAIGMMLAGLAHELNNPLTGVLGAAQLLDEELKAHPAPEVRRAHADLVQPLLSESRRARDLVRNLLLFARKAPPQMETVSLKTAIGVATGLRSHVFAQSGKRLAVEIPDTLHVTVDAQALEHAVINVINNALDAIVPGGGSTLSIRAGRDGDWVNLVFEDDGPGFREPERAFDAFYTTKPVGTGTGLGLALVHQFAESVGGTVTATNVAPRGARLTMRLRTAAAPAPASTARAGVGGQGGQPEFNGAGHRVLVVDDEPAICEIQKRILESMGFWVLLAKSGAEAIATLEREELDAVITDVRMPGEVDGLALYRWIARTRPQIAEHCLFVTGVIDADAATSFLTEHPERVLTKPFDRKEYAARVRAVLGNAGKVG